MLRLRVFLPRRTRLRQATSPPSQVEQQYGTASTLTSFTPSITDTEAVNKLQEQSRDWQGYSQNLTCTKSVRTESNSKTVIFFGQWTLHKQTHIQYICVSISLYIFVSIRICTYMYRHIDVYVCVPPNSYICICVYTCVYILKRKIKP